MGFFDFDNMLSHSLQRLNPSESFLKFFIVLNLFLVAFSANATDYYVSNNGNDSNSGTSPDQAWKTLDKVNSFTPSPGDKILFKCEDEWVGTIKINASGRLGSNIVYGAYGTGAKPKIYGSELVTGTWSVYSGNIYSIPFSGTVNQVFEDGVRLTSARYPNSGYADITTFHSKSSVTARSLPNIDHTNSIAYIRTGRWSLEAETVSRTGNSNTRLYLSASTHYTMQAGDGLFLTNNLEYIDQAGEWYHDGSTLFVWTHDGTSPSNNTVKASTIDNVINISGQSYVTLQNLDIRHANKHGIYADNCDYINLDGLILSDNELMGIMVLDNTSSNFTIKECNITNSYLFGVRANGDNHLLQDNTIENIGLFSDIGLGGINSDMDGQMGTGLFMRRGPGGNNVLRYNTIKNVGYLGIWYYWNPNILVEYNYIKNSCLVIDDGAGIYCFGDKFNPGVEDSDNGIIRYNIIDGCIGTDEGHHIPRLQGNGIYTDEKMAETDVYDNVIANVAGGGIKQHDNNNVTARNNILFNCGLGLNPLNNHDGGNHMKSNTVLNRADVISPDGSQGYLGIVSSTQNAATAIDSNAYYEFHVTYPFKQANDPSASKTFTEWQTMISDDVNSTFYGTPLNTGEYEKLFYNETKTNKRINLGSTIYRDLNGNTVFGIIKLESFNSIILIGKNFENINQQPQISDQSFNILTPKNTYDLLGSIQAIDQDIDQSLSFNIVEGNETNLFSIDSKTGEITTLREIRHQENQVIELMVEVKDNGLYSLSDTARIIITINIPDTSPPGIVLFNIPDTANTLTVSISNFIATDNAIVQGYLISETSKTPDINSTEWLDSPHTSYTFQEEGKKHLYAWAIDSSGNISNAYAATVNIIIPDTIEIFNEVIICEGQDYSGWTEQGKYVQLKPINPDTIKKAVTNIIVKSPQLITEYISIKEGETYKGWENSGIYERTLTDVYGCDSIVTTNLTVLQPTYITEEINICHGESYLEWEETGQYTRTLTALDKADSIVTTNLMVNPVYETEEEITIEEGENYNGWTESGEYRTVYTTSSGCDSIVTTHLIVQNIYSYYEWSTKEKYRRNNEKSVHKNIDSNIFQIYPNPAKSFLIIKHNLHLTEDSYIEINNYNGITLKEKKLDGRVSTKISLDNVPPGMYFIQLKTKQSHLIKKFIIN